jgi:hypothetical protein
VRSTLISRIRSSASINGWTSMRCRCMCASCISLSVAKPAHHLANVPTVSAVVAKMQIWYNCDALLQNVQVVPFKRDVYQAVVDEFAPLIAARHTNGVNGA